jgi:SET family sugar efflux transporter-like MFS transporter
MRRRRAPAIQLASTVAWLRIARSAMSRFVAAFLRVYRQPDFVGVLAGNFALGMAYSFVVPFMSLWGTHHVGMSPMVFGVFMTITSVSAIVLSMTLARWSDTHITRRTMLLWGAVCGMLGYLGYAFVHNVVALTCIGSVLLGIASCNMSQVFAHMRDELERPENAHADGPLLMSVLRVSFSLAWTFGPAVGAWTMVRYSYRGIFLGAASLFAVFLLTTIRFIPHRRHPPTAHAYARQPMARVLTRPDILANYTGFMLLFAAFSICIMDVPLRVTQQLGGTEREVGIIYSIAPFLEIPIMIWSGRLAARGHLMALLRLGVAAAVLYFAALFFAEAPWHIYPMQLLSAIAIGITTNITITFFQDMLPGQAGLATSIYSNSFSGGSLVGYFVFGLAMQSLGLRGVFLLCTTFGLITLAILCFYRQRGTADTALLPAT